MYVYTMYVYNGEHIGSLKGTTWACYLMEIMNECVVKYQKRTNWRFCSMYILLCITCMENLNILIIKNQCISLSCHIDISERHADSASQCQACDRAQYQSPEHQAVRIYISTVRQQRYS